MQIMTLNENARRYGIALLAVMLAITAISGGAILPDDSAPTPIQATGVLAVAGIVGLAIRRVGR